MSYVGVSEFEDAARATARTHEVIATAKGLQSDIFSGQALQRGFLITGNETFLLSYASVRTSVGDGLRKLVSLTTDNKARQHLGALHPLILTKFQEFDNAIALRRSNGFEAASKLVGKGQETMNQIRDALHGIIDHEKGLLATRNAANADNAYRAKAIVVGGALTSIILITSIGIWLAWTIAHPLTEVTRAAETIAAGDYSVRLPVTGRSDEVGELYRAFSSMITTLSAMAGAARRIARGDLTVEITPQSEEDVLGNAFAVMRTELRHSTGELQDAAGTLGSSVSQILAASTQLAAGAVETAASVSQTTITIEEVKQTAQFASQKSGQVSDDAQKAAAISQDGLAAVNASSGSMETIQQQMASIAETVVNLSEQSQAIGEIVAAAADLAEQSNVLAVNAAIEAARAGEQGVGFAVVAREMKALAIQSRQATVQVRGILGDIQKAISRSVIAAEQGDKAVQTGVRHAATAANAIRALANVIESGAQAAIQIAASSRQQSTGMDEVAAAMENIKLACSQNVSSSRQTETAAQNLQTVGEKLRNLAGRYRMNPA
ncbi:MAG: methyl-accepting chemotaxis protein [Candidatus Methylacidiphilales bacterium]|nr:methyl-accepting chemotaxis protein [Candidatus Methylacidiphilales bacterium]